MSYPRLCSDGAPQTAHDTWETWTAGASHAGGSFSLGLWGYWGPPIHNMGFGSRLGESPNTWKHFGQAPTQVLNSVISVLLRQETATWGGCDLGNSGVWERDYGWGVRVRRHLAHAEGVLYGMELGSVTLKINTQHTHWYCSNKQQR